MNTDLFYEITITLRLIFLALFIKELLITPFYNKRKKWFWIFIVLIFGGYGYFIYLTFKRKFVNKRVFNPKFEQIKV